MLIDKIYPLHWSINESFFGDVHSQIDSHDLAENRVVEKFDSVHHCWHRTSCERVFFVNVRADALEDRCALFGSANNCYRD